MKYEEAKNNLSHIYDHVSRSEVYRGYRSIPVALTACVALLAAAVQPVVIGVPEPTSFLLYWTGVAAVSVMITGGPVFLRYRRAESRVKRRRTRKAVGQLLPAILVSALLTVGVYSASPESSHLLPGLWASMFGLGIFASRPFLPIGTRSVAILYCLAGILLVFYAPVLQFSPWGMGLTFGVGQFASAMVLYRGIEHEDEST